MASIPNSSTEQFTQAANDWNLTRLYKDLESAKQQFAPNKKKGLTEVEKLHLRGLLCGYNPQEIAEKLYKSARGLNASLCETLYRYVEQLTKRPINTLKNWREISEWLEEADYKILSSNLVKTKGTIAQFSQDDNRNEFLEISNNSDFVGREEAMSHLNNLVCEGAKVILICAEGGIGKTTLAEKWFERQGFEIAQLLKLSVGTISQDIQPVEDWVRLKLKNYFHETPELNFLTMLEQLKSKLQTHKVGVLIDNLELTLVNGEFIKYHKYRDLLAMLADSSVKSITLIASREPLSEPAIKGLQTYHLKSLNLQNWREYFESRKIIININDLNEMCQAYGGNAEAMFLLSADINNEQFRGNLSIYWRQNRISLLVNPTLKNLVKHQFDRLQEDKPKAYKLLCRIGCYRYHYISVIPEKGIFSLLCDEEDYRDKRQLIKYLQNRALVKYHHDGYYLHQFICEEAIERLKLTNEWRKTNGEAGLFWSEVIAENSKNYAELNTKIFIDRASNSQEQMYLNIENAEKAVLQPLSQQEMIALEIIYHALEFYDLDSLEELTQITQVTKNSFFNSVIQMISEYVETYIKLGKIFHNYGVSTYIVSTIDKNLSNMLSCSKEFECCQRSFRVSQYFFQNSLSIAQRVKNKKLVIEAHSSLAECYYFQGISLHQLGILLYQMFKIQESQKLFEESETKLEESLRIIGQLQESLYVFEKLEESLHFLWQITLNKQFDKVKEAIFSLEISKKITVNFCQHF
ncbi:NB-ARC domain-containing protein [Scytonema sp. NUACC21]